MNVNLPWKKTLLALSISGLVACGGGGGGGTPDNSAGGGTRGDSINRENAAAIASLTAEGGGAGKSSKTPTQEKNSSARSKAAAASRAADSEEDEFDGETDYSDYIGQNYKDTEECEVKGESSYDLTFVKPQANELYRLQGSMRFDDCQDDKADYAYDGTLQIIYSGDDEQDNLELTGEYTQNHKSGVKIVTTNYQETAISTETEYSSTYSYDATGTPFGDKKVHVKTIAPIVTNDESETPLSGAIRIESEDRSFLVMTVSPDGNGVNISVNGDKEEFTSWSELDSVDLNGYVVKDDEDDDSSDDEGSDEDDSDEEGSDKEGSDDDSTDDDTTDDGSSDDDDSTDEDDGGDEDDGEDNETDDDEWDDEEGDDEGDDEEWEDEEGDEESEEDSEDE